MKKKELNDINKEILPTEQQDDERQKEEQHLKECIEDIQHNVDDYTQKYNEMSAETKELYDNYRSNNPELHNDLVVGLDMRSMMKLILDRNLRALKKPYFGRIDYREAGDDENFCLYLGKNGIRKNISENLIIDWRAPISSVYYDSDIGKSSYQTPFGDRIDILLEGKRTYEISDSKLIDFYDSDIVANDEFLTKYLGKNKEVVLGEIIATIQKEQNEIIRDTPWHNVIVQGVAGSGKTTVAMHRISYILYNYKDKFRPDEFYIIGSNKMLLNYITGVLPNLDVFNVNQMTMEEFLTSLLDKDFDRSKGKYTLGNSLLKQHSYAGSEKLSELKRFKGSKHFFGGIMEYMRGYERRAIDNSCVTYHNKIIFTSEDITYFCNSFEELPLQEKIDLLNKRLTQKIAYINEMEYRQKDEIKSEVNKYKNHYGRRNHRYNLMEIYQEFLEDLEVNREAYTSRNIQVPPSAVIKILSYNIHNKSLDIYDLGILTFIKKRLKRTQDFDFVSHIVIDEAQDFGVMLFCLFNKLFKTCTYTIMGDVSQNINYDTGMNDWEILTQEVFLPRKDRFYVLAKSYRNTIEISDYASNVLRKCSFTTYDIEPILRHGNEVSVWQLRSEQQLVLKTAAIICDIQKSGYDTIAVICRTMEETEKVRDELKQYVSMEPYMENMTFQNGVMVLPIYLTKGLEFDAVILWNPTEENYSICDADAKLMYVAITRALHELYVVYQGNLSGLLE
jgi:DNA helicase II / ATP-dependent DNA helicase PcrA